MTFDGLTPQESAFIINLIGEVPTKMGAGGLYEKLKVQHEAQVPKEGEVIPAE
jgi:hypothetical protein